MDKLVRFFILALAGLSILTGCATPTMESNPTASPALPATPTLEITTTATASPTLIPSLHGPYLGQNPPGLTPEIFASGIISIPDSWDATGTFSPDGREYYFTRVIGETDVQLFYTQMIGETWTEPEQLPITAGYAASEAAVTLDNRWLYFIWRKPPITGLAEDPTYYVAERTAEGWSEPKYSGIGMYITSSLDGQLYTTDVSTRRRDGKLYLAKVTVENGLFTQYERLPFTRIYPKPAPIGSPAHPCISPDGSILLFDIEGEFLFVSFRQADGTWGDAFELLQIGFDPLAGLPYISPDGKYLFFTLYKDIWWVDIQVIEALR